MTSSKIIQSTNKARDTRKFRNLDRGQDQGQNGIFFWQKKEMVYEERKCKLWCNGYEEGVENDKALQFTV